MATTPTNSINVSTAGLVKFDGTATFSAVTTTNHDVLVGATSNGITSVGPGSAGQVLQSGGASADPSYSTATYPSTAGTSGNVLTSDGTNWISSTPASLLIASGTLTNAQIKALHATPVTLISAPAAGHSIQIVFAGARLNYGGTSAFTASAAQSIGVFTSTLATGPVTLCTNAMVTSTASKEAFQYATTFVNTAATTYDGLSMVAYNSVATEITGNAANDNTVSYVIGYFILPA